MSSIISLLLQSDLASGIPIQEITFGSPRTGNPAFVQYHEVIMTESWRVVHQLDIVPRVPSDFLDIFHHVPTEIWYMPLGGYTICDGSGEDPTCSLSIPFLETNIGDHLTYFGFDLRVGEQNGCY